MGVTAHWGLGLLLFCFRAMDPGTGLKWNTKLLAFAFWAINIGSVVGDIAYLLPIGLMQTYQSVAEVTGSAAALSSCKLP
jgi:nitric oxide reductase subunit B